MLHISQHKTANSEHIKHDIIIIDCNIMPD